MTSSLIAPYVLREDRELRGSQVARIRSVPPYAGTAGLEAIELARLGGVELDPWQQSQLVDGMGESADWKCPRCTHRKAEWQRCPSHPQSSLIHPWSAFEVVGVCVRQCGKSELLIARMLYGAFVLNEPLQIFSAHLFDTAMEVFLRLVTIVENTPEFIADVRLNRGKVGSYSHGNEGITLKCGARIRFKARTGGGGRGFTCNTLYLDEAWNLPERFLGTTVPTLSAIPNPQLWLASSAVDDENPDHDGVALSKRRVRALAGKDRTMAYFEHSAEGDHPATVAPAVLDDPEVWEQAIPALGIRIAVESVKNERAAMGSREFAVERLGIGAWSATDDSNLHPISPARWAKCLDPTSEPLDPVSFAFDVTPDHSTTSIAVAGRRRDGRWHVGVVDQLQGTDGVPARLAELVKAHKTAGVYCDASNVAAASLLPALSKLKVSGTRPNKSPVKALTANEHGQACARLQDAVGTQGEPQVLHRGQPCMTTAIDGGRRRTIGDGGWAWHRVNSGVDISPLVAITLALWGAQNVRGGSYVTSLSEIAGQTGDDAEADAKLMAEMQAEAEDFYRDVVKADDE